MIGKTISHYKIIDKIGEGGMGIVYKAHDTKLNRTVALKFLPSHIAPSDTERKRFIHEAQSASALDHPNICTIHEIDESPQGQLFIVMSYYEGETLKSKIEQGPLKVEEAVDIANQVAKGLAKAHTHGIVHRDIKPANIIITKDGVAKIVDFGLAKLGGGTLLTKTGTTIGTVAYMSPEQAQGEKVDHRTDIWSLGVILYEMITGRMPFRSEYAEALVYSILNEEPEPVTGIRSGVPMDLERVIQKCLNKITDERYQTARDLIADLHRIQRITSSQDSVDLRNRQRTPVDRVRKLLPWITGTAIALILIAAIVMRFFLPSEQLSVAERKMLVVLPFENLGLPEHEYFADGITEEIISRLAGISGLGVIARSSAMQYKKTDKPIKQIGEELGVGYILEGTIRWETVPGAENRVRINPRLIDVADGTQMWSEPYEAALTGIFRLQANIAERVTNALDVVLLAEEKRKLEREPTSNQEAYDLYLRALEYHNRSIDQRDLTFAVQVLERAVGLDSAFAHAYSLLARSHASMYWQHYDRSSERAQKAREAAERAAFLAPDLAEGYKAMGYYYYHIELSYEKALNEFNKALRVQPNDADIIASIGYVYRRQGQMREAKDMQENANHLDPRSAVITYNLALTHDLLRDYSEAERFYRRSIDLSPEWVNPYVRVVYIYLSRDGDIHEAQRILEKTPPTIGTRGVNSFEFASPRVDMFNGSFEQALYKLNQSDVTVFEDQYIYIPRSLLLANIYDYLDRHDGARKYYSIARRELEKYLKSYPDDPRALSSLGIAHAGLGLKSEALRIGRQAYELMPITEEAYRGTCRLEDLAHIYVMTGEYELAVKELDTLLSIPSMMSVWTLRLDPKWGPLRGHPEFERLIKTL
jgi:eukaryotic-like serine/threonine-protein kinase